jgi:hypothetical protein
MGISLPGLVFGRTNETIQSLGRRRWRDTASVKAPVGVGKLICT